MASISIAAIEIYFNSYIIPFLSCINIINNLTFLIFVLTNQKLQKSLPKTVYLNYIAMAVNDINNTLYMQISHFIGTHE